jgi:hypothetical protein
MDFISGYVVGSMQGALLKNLFFIKIIFVPFFLLPILVSAQTRTLRIVTYNIEADIGVTNVQPTFTNRVAASAEGPPLPGLIAPPTNPTNVLAGGALEGIGEENVGSDPAQVFDILALEETTSNPQTVAPIVNGLNSFYNSPGRFTNSSYQATEQFGDPTFGDGPNAVVFNTKTVQLLASVPVDPPGGANNLGATYGEYREVMRYEFAPAGVAPASSNEFYIYVSHYKSGSGNNNMNARTGEAQIIRTNEAIALSPTARVLYVGDYNITSNYEASDQIIISNVAPDGIAQGGGIDPGDPNNQPINWHSFTTNPNILAQETEDADYIQYRDDLELMTTNVFFAAPAGLKYVPGTYHTFGNNGSIGYQSTVNSEANTSLQNLATNGPVFISAAQIFVDLTGAADHLPVVADYTIPLPQPRVTAFALAGTNLNFTVANSITGGVFNVLVSTNLLVPLKNWTALTTNIANTGTFNLTLTNYFNPTASAQFFTFQEK